MKHKSGFTLIELLIVVLIIGILAAIALPSYYNTVKASRLKTRVNVLRPLIEAEKRYKLAAGQYQPDIDLLDVSVPYNTKTLYSNAGDYSTDWGTFRIIFSGENMNSLLRIGLFNMPEFNGAIALFDPDDKASFEALYPGVSQYSGICTANDNAAAGICKAIGTLLYTNGSSKYFGF